MELWEKQKPVLENNQGLLNVLIIEDSNNLPTSLGITEERSDAINDILRNAFNSSDTITEVMVKVSKQVTHANELSYAMFHLGGYVDKLTYNR